jgi:chemotaxis protein CheD
VVSTLKPGGYFCIGHSESLHGMCTLADRGPFHLPQPFVMPANLAHPRMSGNDGPHRFLQPGDLFVGDAGFQHPHHPGLVCVDHAVAPGEAHGRHVALPAADTRAHPFAKTSSTAAMATKPCTSSFADCARPALDRRWQCQAKVFGGGNMFPGNQHARGHKNIGHCGGSAQRRGRARVAAHHGIQLVTESLFGSGSSANHF